MRTLFDMLFLGTIFAVLAVVPTLFWTGVVWIGGKILFAVGAISTPLLFSFVFQTIYAFFALIGAVVGAVLAFVGNLVGPQFFR